RLAPKFVFYQYVTVAAWDRAPGIYPRLLIVEVYEQPLLGLGLHYVVLLLHGLLAVVLQISVLPLDLGIRAGGTAHV
ncbi:MAG: hypothetical protein ACKPKO_33810, partial [Candidatus Fonsibacter sp.]